LEWVLGLPGRGAKSPRVMMTVDIFGMSGQRLAAVCLAPVLEVITLGFITQSGVVTSECSSPRGRVGASAGLCA